ncbi:hypothetical protein [Nocardioides flavescens]|uniref:Uncharacterized protein n=1 Tax=Nocardioides flavescens TaxID=2691959 RepID=A0A6L7EWN0_9ACTN|nr:hypothetical protein [Nocardioides flavescens]MXG88429.1 hypothetical protein [Nocardioides flavescens]
MRKRSLFDQIYKLRLLLVGLTLFGSGLLLAALGEWLDRGDFNHLLVAVVNGLADVLVVTGALGLALDFFVGQAKDEADLERNRAVVRELVPDFTDAVVKGFAGAPEDLERVATPELLDQLATNALALRLGDTQFASELYADLRDQAIRAPERWHDAQVRVWLHSSDEPSSTGAELFDVLVEWEYTTIPTHPVQRFACVSDREEFHELVSDVPATLTWFMTARDGLIAAEQRNYELLTFSVDGAERPIRRSQRAQGQTYSAAIGEDIVAACRPVRIRQLYRTVTPKHGHRLYFEVGQPTRQFSLEVDYTDTDIAQMSVTELVSSSHRSRVSQMPQQVDARVLGVDLPGWLLPKSGFAFVWTLVSEQPATSADGMPSARSKTA